MTIDGANEAAPISHPYAADIAKERQGWQEIVALVRSLTADEWLEPGYYRDPDWTVRDVVAHLGTWLAEAEIQFQRITAGTYGGNDIDIDTTNAVFLEAMTGQPWEVAWVQANSARTRMIDEWYDLSDRNDEAAWWIRKTASDHYAEHLDRLREWVGELVRKRPPEPAGGM